MGLVPQPGQPLAAGEYRLGGNHQMGPHGIELLAKPSAGSSRAAVREHAISMLLSTASECWEAAHGPPPDTTYQLQGSF